MITSFTAAGSGESGFYAPSSGTVPTNEERRFLERSRTKDVLGNVLRKDLDRRRRHGLDLDDTISPDRSIPGMLSLLHDVTRTGWRR